MKGRLINCLTYSPLDRERKKQPACTTLIEVEGVYYYAHPGRLPYNVGVVAPNQPRVNQTYEDAGVDVEITQVRHKKPANYCDIPPAPKKPSRKRKPKKKETVSESESLHDSGEV